LQVQLSTSAATEEYDGTNWATSPGSLATARYYLGGCGTQTAALAVDGTTATAPISTTEEYNGSTWTSNPTSLNTLRARLTAVGIQTAALAFGGGTRSTNYRSNRRI
jgi:hypothetical protein